MIFSDTRKFSAIFFSQLPFLLYLRIQIHEHDDNQSPFQRVCTCAPRLVSLYLNYLRMARKSSLTLETGTRQYLAQMQIRLAKILELSPPELEERVAREVEENPALEAVDDHPAEVAVTADGDVWTESEEKLRKADYADPDDIPPYRLNANNRSADDDRRAPVAPDTSASIYDLLLDQLTQRNVSGDVATAARYIIGNLDSNGYLRRSVTGIADDILFDLGKHLPEGVIEEAVAIVQSLEPYGLAARDLRECLLIQLRHRPASPTRDDAINILENAFEAFSMKHSHRIISDLHIPTGRVEEAVRLIRTLNPKPGASIGEGPGSGAPPVIPDFVVDIDDEGITVSLNNSLPELRISESFETAMRMMKDNAERRKAVKGAEFLTRTHREARDFISLLAQRQKTLFAVMTAIVNHQREYFMTEDVHRLRPMGIKDIAAATGYDQSVISRATAGKYVATPWGVHPLRFFFSDSLGEGNGVFTAKGVQDVLRQLIDNEDKRHPLSDEKLTSMLAERGYNVSRRVVAKYRDRLEIPVARLRKHF